MLSPDTNIVLIGMPGSGKSTLGPRLARAMERTFIDTDEVIETAEGLSLQEIVDQGGPESLREAEARHLSQLRAHNAVIATGGSAVYSQQAMEHLKRNGLVIFLNVSLKGIRQRIGDFSLRGLYRKPGQSLEDLYRERQRLYHRYADRVIRAEGATPAATCRRVLAVLEEEGR